MKGLPTGNYTITESGYTVDGYDPTAFLNGAAMKDFSAPLTLGANQNQRVILINTYDHQYRELKVTKRSLDTASV